MYNFLEVEMQCAQRDIKHNKLAVRCFFGMTVVNSAFLLANAYSAYFHGSVISAMGLGAFVVNFFYSLTMLLEYISDYKQAKRMLWIIKEKQSDESIQKYYNDFYRSISKL